jgi:7-keto-8-aminopelargonate synthetase-like enzyme
LKIRATNAKGLVQGEDGQQYLNFASCDFLGINHHPRIQEIAAKTIDKYGVGSCGPRGFYGTIDVHLDVEAEFAKWIGTEDAILYPDGIACISSVIPVFSKKEDLIFWYASLFSIADEGLATKVSISVFAGGLNCQRVMSYSSNIMI